METYPSPQDQYMLELVNEARANPQAEADRLLGGDLNEGLDPGTISTTAKQPLAFNLNLNASAEGHSQWMLNNNTFSHTGANGSSSHQRMSSAGYSFTGAWGSGENIAWVGTTGTPDFTTFAEANYEDLFIDEDYDGRGHRISLMNGNFQEIGLSSLEGEFTANNGTTYNAVMTTQNFAYSSNRGPFITGVAYTDAVTDDDFYTVGEGVAGVTVTAVDNSNNSNTVTTTTWDAGGYTLEVTSGSYTVSFSGDFNGDSQSDTVSYQVTVGSENVKQDLVTDSISLAPQPTPGDDNLTYTGAAETIDALGGNDIIKAKGGADDVFGNDGNDKLIGQGGADTLSGGAGNDTLNGGGGNDVLIGVDENSANPGQGEKDILQGKNGNDSFILGNADTPFYNHDGGVDKAIIKDFTAGDMIQLNGSASDYLLKVTGSGNTNILYQPFGETKDLVGIVTNVTHLELDNSEQFSFVG